MRIKGHTAVLVGIITAAGILLGSGLVAGYQRIEAKSYQLGPNAGAMKDVKRLQSLMGQWLLSTDLVLNGGETFMHRASERQSRELFSLVSDLRGAALAADNQADLNAIKEAVTKIRELVTKGAELSGEDRTERLHSLVRAADEISTPLVRVVEGLEGALLTKSKYLEDKLVYDRWLLGIIAWCAAMVYLLVIGVAGFWTVRTVVRPIELLSLAAENATVDDTEFALEARGPEEVRLLTNNITTFVTELQAAKEIVEEEVRIRTAQLIKANEAKSEFLAKMSHELRTPLNGVINMNELILNTHLSPEQREYARIAKAAGDALLGLINDILDFSKIEAEMLELESTEFDLREVIEGVSQILSSAALAGDLQLVSIVGREVPGRVIGDPLRLRQILMNLISNALKYTSEGSVVTRVSRLERRGDKEVLMFRVTDTGLGIPEDRISSLFEAFVQADSSTTRRFGGTGLGLSICKQLVELMDGEIGVDSEVGSGSTFWFTICIPVRPKIEEMDDDIDLDKTVLVLSGRDLVRQQLLEHFLYLGFTEEQVYLQQGAEFHPQDIPENLVTDPSQVLAICDVLGQQDVVSQLRSGLGNLEGEGAPRICEIRHFLAQDSNSGAEIDGVDTLVEPIQFEALSSWVVGKSASSEDRSTFEEDIDQEITWNLLGKVLIVEDNPINQHVAITILERAGLECVTVDNGQEAVDYLKSDTCDLVLMDCEMPVMDGWESTRTIRELEESSGLAMGCPPHLPIIAVTANALGGERQRCIQAGMDDYVAKPVKASLLLKTVARYLAVKV